MNVASYWWRWKIKTIRWTVFNVNWCLFWDDCWMILFIVLLLLSFQIYFCHCPYCFYVFIIIMHSHFFMLWTQTQNHFTLYDTLHNIKCNCSCKLNKCKKNERFYSRMYCVYLINEKYCDWDFKMLVPLKIAYELICMPLLLACLFVCMPLHFIPWLFFHTL